MAAKKTSTRTTKSTAPDAAAPTKPAVKKAAPAKARKAVAKKVAATEPIPASTTKKVIVKPSLDAIARAAYLNYRRRVEQGLPGDSHGDWLEAERQFNQPS
jgi:hypothetical protein